MGIWQGLILSVFVYLIVPIVWVKFNGRVEEKKAKKIALWNSICCAILFVIIGIAIDMTPSQNGTMFAPAFLYYFIAKSILTKQDQNEEK